MFFFSPCSGLFYSNPNPAELFLPYLKLTKKNKHQKRISIKNILWPTTNMRDSGQFTYTAGCVAAAVALKRPKNRPYFEFDFCEKGFDNSILIIQEYTFFLLEYYSKYIIY